jgi:DNA polymerase III epsilon subunit-like protein
MPDSLASKRKICTMQGTTNFCKINGLYGYKWPKLSELHYKLFRENFEEEHNAAVDIHATAKCFWELRRLGKI